MQLTSLPLWFAVATHASSAPRPRSDPRGEIAGEEEHRGRLGRECHDDRRAIAVILEPEERLLLADEQEHERRRGKPDPSESEQDVERSQPRRRDQEPDPDQRRPGEVEREERPDDRHDAEVHCEVLLEMHRPHDQHRDRSERAQETAPPARASVGLSQERLVRGRPRRVCRAFT
ncbi:MAG TPA: hypothetical protein VFK17_03105 [Gaiellaceae bacterium]|jgi:hypothetical protein|nr:hypothetical protein [Gaiellaceae bacterium]